MPNDDNIVYPRILDTSRDHVHVIVYHYSDLRGTYIEVWHSATLAAERLDSMLGAWGASEHIKDATLYMSWTFEDED